MGSAATTHFFCFPWPHAADAMAAHAPGRPFGCCSHWCRHVLCCANAPGIAKGSWSWAMQLPAWDLIRIITKLDLGWKWGCRQLPDTKRRASDGSCCSASGSWLLPANKLEAGHGPSRQNPFLEIYNACFPPLL